MVIVIIGVLAGMVAVFIRIPMQNYADSAARAELVDGADSALRRMARDLRLALPNSIRISGDGRSLEFLIAKTGGRYLAADDGVAALPVLDFINPAATTFTVVGAMPTLKQQILPGDYIVVQNLGPDFEPANAYAYPSGNIALVSAVDAGLNQVTIQSNPFAAQIPPMPSPDSRFQVVTGPVTYYCQEGANGTGMLTRQWNYPISLVQNSPAAGAGLLQARVVQRVTSCEFKYDTAATQRSALIVLKLEMQAAGGTDLPVSLTHQIHVDNTP